MIDIHSHILPYIDDGAKNMQESIAMLDVAKSIGITTIVATPHLKKIGHLALLEDVFDEVSFHARERGIDLQQAYEFHSSLLVDLPAKQLHRYCIPDTNLLLLEFSRSLWPTNVIGLVDSILRENIRPIIAHPERYTTVQQNPKMMLELASMGCYLQISASSMSPRFWNKKRKTAKALEKHSQRVYFASDAHNAKDYQRLGKLMKQGHPVFRKEELAANCSMRYFSYPEPPEWL